MGNICSESGCEREVMARGLCGAHYQQAWKAGVFYVGPSNKPCVADGCPRLTRTQRAAYCEPCSNLRRKHAGRKHYLANRDAILKRHGQRAKDPDARSRSSVLHAERHRAKKIAKRIGADLTDIEIMLEIPVCQICGTSKKLVVDHVKDTTRLRGRLCGNCNTAIGLLYHDAARLHSAARYLSEGPTPRPVVLLDQDGPLAAFDDAAFSTCADRGWTVDCAIDNQRHRFITEHMPNEEERRRLRATIDQPGWFRNLPVVEGAREGLEELSKHAEVWICSKPLWTNPTSGEDKEWWLDKHFGKKWTRRLILAPNKSVVQGSLLLDDAPNLEEITRAPWIPVVYPMNWNQAGSQWEGLPTWSWGDDPLKLVEMANANSDRTLYDRMD